MNIERFSFVVALLFVVLCASAYGEKISEKSKRFQVTYSDGSKETILVKYQGMLDASQHQDGSVSKPFEGHPIDDRHCVWSIKTYVLRQAFFVSKSGQQAEIGSLSRVFDDVISNSRGPTNKSQATGYHVTCGSVQELIDSQETSAKSSLEAGFDDMVKNDAVKVEKDLKDLLHPVNLETTNPSSS